MGVAPRVGASRGKVQRGGCRLGSLGLAWLCRRVLARSSTVRTGGALNDMAGVERSGLKMLGLYSRGNVRVGKARQDGRGLARPGAKRYD